MLSTHMTISNHVDARRCYRQDTKNLRRSVPSFIIFLLTILMSVTKESLVSAINRLGCHVWNNGKGKITPTFVIIFLLFVASLHLYRLWLETLWQVPSLYCLCRYLWDPDLRCLWMYTVQITTSVLTVFWLAKVNLFVIKIRLFLHQLKRHLLSNSR